MEMFSNSNTDYDDRSKEEGKDQESIQSSNTPDPGHHITQETIIHKRAKRLALDKAKQHNKDKHET